MNATRHLFGILFVLLLAGNARAQGRTYHIGPRDVLSITIHAGGELQSQADLTVSAEGKINVPFIGIVRAEELTVPQLEALIGEPLAEDYFVNPEVNISIKEYHSLQYYISGAVKLPGLYEMTSRASLMELIAKAGGMVPERGNVAYILRSGTRELSAGQKVESLIQKSEPLRVDLTQLLDRGDMTQNLDLLSGDVVYIPLQKALNASELKIYLEGEVKNPGIYDYRPGLTVLHACIMAGGFAKHAAPNRTKIIRQNGDDTEIIKINLKEVKDGEIPDVKLKPGDRIHIPETWL